MGTRIKQNGAHPKMRAVRQAFASMRVGNAKGQAPVLSTTRNTLASLFQALRSALVEETPRVEINGF